MTKRLFVAIPMSQYYLKFLENYQNEDGVSSFDFIPLKNLHITVYFLGDVDTRMIPNLVQRLRDTISLTKEFALKFKKIIFAPDKEPNMLWMTFEKSSRFFNLVDAVTKIAEEFVESKNINPIIPHVTLASVKNLEKTFNKKLKQPKIKDNLEVKSYKLIESKPVSKEQIYSVIEVFNLAS